MSKIPDTRCYLLDLIVVISTTACDENTKHQDKHSRNQTPNHNHLIFYLELYQLRVIISKQSILLPITDPSIFQKLLWTSTPHTPFLYFKTLPITFRTAFFITFSTVISALFTFSHILIEKSTFGTCFALSRNGNKRCFAGIADILVFAFLAVFWTLGASFLGEKGGCGAGLASVFGEGEGAFAGKAGFQGSALIAVGGARSA